MTSIEMTFVRSTKNKHYYEAADKTTAPIESTYVKRSASTTPPKPTITINVDLS